MTRPLTRAVPLALALLTGCATGVSIDEAYGRPDATDWTYFEEGPSSVVGALVDHFQLRQDIRVEAVQEDDHAGGTLITLTMSGQGGSPDYNQILVQRSPVEGFGARAQIYPRQDPLPRDLEVAVSGRASRR